MASSYNLDYANPNNLHGNLIPIQVVATRAHPKYNIEYNKVIWSILPI